MKMRNSSTLFKFNLMAFSTIVCFINMAFQEQVLRIVPESSNFISFVQHLFISFCGFRTNGLPFILPRKQSSIRLSFVEFSRDSKQQSFAKFRCLHTFADDFQIV
ncbi:hypothetical protein SSS_01613 [Sarcoptes scabiei]|nr:hypothetical protein SSS_01613 [Sarcoptes scabiei]